MPHRRHPAAFAAFALVAAASIGLLASARATPAVRLGPPSPAAIAIIDLPKVLDGLKSRQAKDEGLKAAEAELKKTAEKLEGELKAEVQVVDAMPDTPAKITAAKALRAKKKRAEFDIDYGKALLAEQQAEGLKELYSEVKAAVAELAKTRGYHLVMSSDEGVPVRGNYDQVTQTVSLKRFFYVDPAMDISDDLVQFMNNQFAAGGGGGTAAPAKPK